MNSVSQFITVLLIFLFVLGITYFVTRWLGNFQKTQGRSGNIELIESARIAPNVYVEIVRIGQKYVALSVGKDTSAYICDVPREDIVFKDDGTVSNVSFGDILSKMRGGSDVTDESKTSGNHRDE